MRLWERATTFANMMTLVQAALCWFLVQQMEWGSGAGMAVKVSYLTIGMQAAIDCYFFILTFTVGLVTSQYSAHLSLHADTDEYARQSCKSPTPRNGFLLHRLVVTLWNALHRHHTSSSTATILSSGPLCSSSASAADASDYRRRCRRTTSER